MKTIILRDRTGKILSDGKKRTTNQITDIINKTYRHGTTNNVMGNILHRYPEFHKIGTTKCAGYSVTLWTLTPDYEYKPIVKRCNTKLNKEKIREIRKISKENPNNYELIGKKFNISIAVVKKIRDGESWAWVK